MAPVFYLGVGILLLVSGLILLTNRRGYEAAIKRDRERGWLTSRQAEALSRAWIWVAIMNVVVGSWHTTGYFLNH
jgi:hypothetical protein